jgi:hypothetical protein
VDPRLKAKAEADWHPRPEARPKVAIEGEVKVAPKPKVTLAFGDP